MKFNAILLRKNNNNIVLELGKMDVQDSRDEILETQLRARLVAATPKSKDLCLTGQIPAHRLLKNNLKLKCLPVNLPWSIL